MIVTFKLINEKKTQNKQNDTKAQNLPNILFLLQ